MPTVRLTSGIFRVCTAIAAAVFLFPAFSQAATVSQSSFDQELSLLDINNLPKSRITAMREAYKKAEDAYKDGKISEGDRIVKSSLKGYPLKVWLDYYRLAYNFDKVSFDEVFSFIQKSGHAELSRLLKDSYAVYLSDNRDYPALSKLIGPKEFDENKITNLSFTQKIHLCRFYEANWPLNQVNEDALRFATRLYLDLGNRPTSCAPFMRRFDKEGYLADTLIMKRFEKAYVSSRHEKTVKALSEVLQRKEFKDRVNVLLDLYENPEEYSKLENDSEDHHRAAVLAFRRYASLSPRSARNEMKAFIRKYEPSEVEILEIYRTFAAELLGRSFDRSDVRWVDENLPVLAWTDALKEQRLRRAVYFGQWDNVYLMTDYLPADIKNKVNWLYWRARAAKELGRADEAKVLFAKVAADRSFFGFYAAQETGTECAFNYRKIDGNFSFPKDIADNKAAVRFFELYAMNDNNADYEWREIAVNSPEKEAMVMAQWALQSGNFRYAIDYVIKSGNWDALDYRFPLAYRDLYEKASAESGVSLSFLYGISRQESMLNHKIRSYAGAVGLMQLMPSTAKLIARKEKRDDYKGPSSLIDPATNISYGSTYIKWMLERFDNNRILAAAAYNAGPNRIPRWRSDDGLKRDAAVFVESIPFAETRGYVQNVLLYDSIYNYLLTGKAAPFLTDAERKMSY